MKRRADRLTVLAARGAVTFTSAAFVVLVCGACGSSAAKSAGLDADGRARDAGTTSTDASRPSSEAAPGAGSAVATSPEPAGSEAGSGSTPGSCIPGRCTCADGRPGSLRCDPGAEGSCECPACETFTPGTHVAFDGCAGLVEGTWHLVSSRGIVGDLRDLISFATDTPCPVAAEDRTDIGKSNFLLDLRADAIKTAIPGGTARATPFYADVHLLIDKSCLPLLSSVTPAHECTDVGPFGGQCSDVCSACDCWDGHSFTGNLARYKYTDIAGVVLVSAEGAEESYAFCAKDNRLTLRSATTEYVLEKKFLIGDCKLEDYGVLPGCDFATDTTVCAGTAQPCSEYNGYDCTAPGCTSVDGCQGPEWDCADNCTVGAGCTPTDGGCVGRGSCAAYNETVCSGHGGCAWMPSCTGTAQPCSSYALDDCANHPGCTYPTKP